MLSYGFKHKNTNKCMYSKSTGHFSVIICLHIDNLLIFGIIVEMYLKLENILLQDLNKRSK